MRHRNMYYMTGLPGWMRFGYSPGWVGRSPSGLGPCAEYLMSGAWPTPQMAGAWDNMQAGQAPAGPMGYQQPWPGAMGGVPANQLSWLQQQAQMLQQQLEQINAEIARLEQAEG
ncbi:MAG: hypothetical protein GX100_09445 [candidate division WS1 bacterium]|jgi:hypothetical protein|nr:hypothetical protein [candidate division WS1 bacterium]